MLKILGPPLLCAASPAPSLASLKPSSSVAWWRRGFCVVGAGWTREMEWRVGENERRAGGGDLGESCRVWGRADDR
jgi:hypothetical protein